MLKKEEIDYLNLLYSKITIYFTYKQKVYYTKN